MSAPEPSEAEGPDESVGASRPTELPYPVRLRVIALADETLAALAEDEVPASLRAVRRFTPGKRARLGAASLGAALETEPVFRAAVVARVREGLPAVSDAIDAGLPATAAPAVDVAAVAYLLDSPDWQERVAALQPAGSSARGAQRSAERPDRVRREVARSVAREDRKDLAQLRDELASVRREADDLRRRLNRSESEARRSVEAHEETKARLEETLVGRVALERELSAEARRLRTRLRDAEASAAAARRGTRSERDVQAARLRVLLETVTGAAAGLRRELDLPLAVTRPADLLGGEEPGMEQAAGLPGLLSTLRRGRAADDPALVDDVLTVPGVHLIIDGYNVTKLGYPTLTLEGQRGRLVSGLAGLAGRASGAELTCVFDATAATTRPVSFGVPRGVRILFSAPGELADELIIRLAGAEPAGRPVVVVTNDREVVDAVRRAGGEALPSAALLGRLDRA